MTDRITMEGRDGTFGAYIARPKVLSAPAVVVLHEVFGVNADKLHHLVMRASATGTAKQRDPAAAIQEIGQAVPISALGM
jgi:dienelactone hydrolase